jgi:hypothetical protein
MKVTLPVASDGVTVAVKVTESPYTDGFAEEPRTVLVVRPVTAWLTVFDVLLSYVESPL